MTHHFPHPTLMIQPLFPRVGWGEDPELNIGASLLESASIFQETKKPLWKIFQSFYFFLILDIGEINREGHCQLFPDSIPRNYVLKEKKKKNAAVEEE